MAAVAPRSPYLDEIRRLDPEADHKRIVHLISCYEFPWDTTRALELAFFRTYAVPRIGTLLDRTREFAERAQKRYDDTDLIVSAIAEDGYDSVQGKAALRRMNHIHGRHWIENEDFAYVLSNFIFEPVRFTDRFGWRRMTEIERQALFHFWREVGRRMNIQDLPATREEYERFNIDFERENFAHTPGGERVAIATRTMFLRWFPILPQRLGARGMSAILDDPLIDALGFQRPTAVERKAAELALRSRGRAVRLLPPRKKPRRRVDQKHRSYPNGWKMEDLGPAEQTEAPELV